MSWLLDLVPWWAYAAAVALILLAARLYLGRAGFLAVAAALGTAFAYHFGKRGAERKQQQLADDIERKRQDAYNEIDQRGTTRRDVVDRLRKGDY